MSGFSSFVLAFCTVCVIMGGLYILCPNGNMSRSVKFAMSLAFICAILSCITDAEIFVLPDMPPQTQVSISDDMSVSAVRLVFETALKNGGINFSKITVCTDKTADGSISISEIVVYSSEPAEKIIALIGNPDVYEVRVVDE